MPDKKQSIQQQLNFFNLDGDLSKSFAEIAKAVDRYAPSALDSFYAKAAATPSAARHFSSPQMMQGASTKQLAHWRQLFAVVANEVRALAQRSADAAKDIKELITQSWSQVETGVKLVSQTGAALDRIVERVGEITRLTGEISHAASEQAVSTQQVNSVVIDMDKMTQQNAAMVEESTAAARSLADEAQKLAGLVEKFEINRGPGARRQVKSTPAPQIRAAPRRSGNLAIAADPDWNAF